MADEAKLEPVTKPTEDMDVQTLDTSDQIDGDATVNGGKRPREGEVPEEEENGEEGKKMKVEKPVVVKSGSAARENETDIVPTGPVTVGTKSFDSSVEMFDYFYKLLHFWPPNFNVNKYEHLMLLDLVNKGHPEPEKKIKAGVHAFQVRLHPQFKSRCFFIVRENRSFDDFSFRKCVDHILPLPQHMQLKSEESKAFGGGRGHWRGLGRGGKPRN